MHGTDGNMRHGEEMSDEEKNRDWSSDLSPTALLHKKMYDSELDDLGEVLTELLAERAQEAQQGTPDYTALLEKEYGQTDSKLIKLFREDRKMSDEEIYKTLESFL